MTAQAAPAIGLERRARSARARRAALAGLGVLLVAFLALGTWQVERRAWKLALIERVEQRVHAEPVAVPQAGLPADRLAADWDYRHVRVTGRFRADADTYVQAVTDLGAGFWVLTPLQLTAGNAVLVNRGFIETKPAAAPPDGPQTVVGLLRLSEPRGGFLRHNDAAADRWFSRDVEAIAAARQLGPVAPFFIDADASRGPVGGAGVPVGGLTVVRFANSHLVYAVTWYTLALLCIAGAVALVREDRAPRGRPSTKAGR